MTGARKEDTGKRVKPIAVDELDEAARRILWYGAMDVHLQRSKVPGKRAEYDLLATQPTGAGQTFVMNFDCWDRTHAEAAKAINMMNGRIYARYKDLYGNLDPAGAGIIGTGDWNEVTHPAAMRVLALKTLFEFATYAVQELASAKARKVEVASAARQICIREWLTCRICNVIYAGGLPAGSYETERLKQALEHLDAGPEMPERAAQWEILLALEAAKAEKLVDDAAF